MLKIYILIKIVQCNAFVVQFFYVHDCTETWSWHFLIVFFSDDSPDISVLKCVMPPKQHKINSAKNCWIILKIRNWNLVHK